MTTSFKVFSGKFNILLDHFGTAPFFPPTCDDYNPAEIPGFIVSYEEICMIDDDNTELPGRKMALHLASPNPSGDTFWNTETEEYIEKFKELSGVVGYSMTPITMFICNTEKKTIDMVAPPENFPVTFRVNKKVGDDYVLVKYLQYTENGSMRHYSKK
jgi:hypothetical protein